MNHQAELATLIDILIQQSGSDLHISTGRHPAIRAAEELVFLSTRPEMTKEDVTGILTVLVGEEKVKRFLAEEEVDFAYDHQGKARLRGNAFFQKGEIAIALRLIPQVRTLEELKLPPILAEFAHKKQGFFLVVGPVGQGKSTTLAAMISLINNERTEHIVTIEDPIEYIYKPNKSIIDQREVGIDTRGFDTALKSIFREDVNVIMIGEMRSPETIATAVTAAETGHLVFSTLHTNNASQTIDRIVDSFPPEGQGQIRNQLAGSLLGIFSQRLIPRVAGGLVPAYELLINTPAVANLIRENRTKEIDVLIETGTSLGMIDMNRSLADLVRRGEITLEDAYQNSTNPKALEGLVG